ncbi:hypothetical protein L596_009866 [Steinernema carpocapsae]|uniref:Uncharacterized protein n=1 Tax=Steinernema carpocapsae TaxID=34508 RepID=A0A4U5PGT8_STECR|nr:hypothetical protein L596_009866 [Steinernema carpocapsae]
MASNVLAIFCFVSLLSLASPYPQLNCNCDVIDKAMHRKGESMTESIFWHMSSLTEIFPMSTQGPFTLSCTGLQPVADVFNHRLGVVDTYVKDFVRCSCSGNRLQQFYKSLYTLWNYIHHFLAEGN